MYKIFLYKIVMRLIIKGIAGFPQIEGCSRGEINEIKALSKFALPKIYVAFLSVMGREAGDFFRGTNIFYPEILRNREVAEELLRDDESTFTLSPQDFVFSHHQGYQFNYFSITKDEEDPAVYHYMEGESPKKVPEKISEHFSEYLLWCLKDHEDSLKLKY